MSKTIRQTKRTDSFTRSFGKRNALAGKYGRRNDWKVSIRREGVKV